MSSVLVHLLFFYLYGDHRELHVLTHSFPTRRSSDLVAQPLEVEQDRCVDRQRQLAAVHQVEDLAPLPAVVWPLGDADEAHVLDPPLLDHPFPPVQRPPTPADHPQTGPGFPAPTGSSARAADGKRPRRGRVLQTVSLSVVARPRNKK